jgi:catalase
MPPKSNQTTTLTSLFSKGVKASTPEAAKEVADAEVLAFYASLTPNERKAHTIAATDLGTSYDVRTTHGFRRWFLKRAH